MVSIYWCSQTKTKLCTIWRLLSWQLATSLDFQVHVACRNRLTRFQELSHWPKLTFTINWRRFFSVVPIPLFPQQTLSGASRLSLASLFLSSSRHTLRFCSFTRETRGSFMTCSRFEVTRFFILSSRHLSCVTVPVSFFLYDPYPSRPRHNFLLTYASRTLRS